MKLSPQDYGIIILILSNLGVWGREWLKHRSWRSQNGQTDQIEKDVKAIKIQNGIIGKNIHKANLAMARIETKVSAQTKHCQTTVRAVNQRIEQNQNQIFELAKEQKN